MCVFFTIGGKMFGQQSKHQLLKDSHVELDKFVRDIYVTDDYLIRHTRKYMRDFNKLQIKLN